MTSAQRRLDFSDGLESSSAFLLDLLLEGADVRRTGPGEAPEVAARGTSRRKRWSQRVTETSDALDLEEGVFGLEDPRAIARSLKRSAERSKRRRSDPFRSAMSMLTFYINRAGRQLPGVQRARLEAAKDELRSLFGRPRKAPRKGRER